VGVGLRFLVLALALGAFAGAASPAQASFHLMKVREVYPAGDASYVELQMFSAGEYLVGGHALGVYNANGSEASSFVLPNNVSISSPNNSTVLITDSGYPAAFPSGPATNELDTNLNLSTAGGAVCWVDGSPPDCVAWGNFTGPLPAHVPPFAVGSPASPGGVTAGMALRRSIAPGCSTLLEAADDTDVSATDFSEQTPNPRNNASAIPEVECHAPSAIIDSKPANPTKSTSAAFTFHSSPAGASFECKLDLGAFASCEASGISYVGPLSEGGHTFQVRATDVNGTGTPASYPWTVDTTAPTATIDTHPSNPSGGTSPSFTFHASEAGSKFECSLAKEAAPDVFSTCTSAKTYPTIEEDGIYTFKVRATDKALNKGEEAEFEWEVDTSLIDKTAPETTVLSKPSDPSESSTASFTYEANEPASTFECKLDAASFASCPATGISYTGLANGPHSFQVRAKDPSGNTDATPAGYSFSVAVLGPPALPPSPPPPPPPPASPPETTITAKPPAKTHDRTPAVRFNSGAAGARFECSVDSGLFKACRSPFTAPRLAPGRHRIRVRAIAGGLTDASPASASFKVVASVRKH
jgi:hypothetical protein